MTIHILAFFRTRLARRGQVRADRKGENRSPRKSVFTGEGGSSPSPALTRQTAAKVLYLHCANAAGGRREWVK